MERVSCTGMNGSGHGVNSYANNSIPQRTVLSKTKPLVELTIVNIMRRNKSSPEQCFAMADMGCASGPNTLLSLSNIIDAIVRVCQSPLQLHIFLNDLPSNDFNSVFESLPAFHKRMLNEKERGSMPCYVSGTPGSFYGRLFPSSSLYFVHSSYSLHWLSQVPRGIENNKENIYIGNTSPKNVSEAYKEQFGKDFSNFLRCRAMEMKAGGGMILAFIGNRDDSTTTTPCLLLGMLCTSLLDMVDEGKVEKGEVDSFNIPHYFPSKGEVKEIVERQGSFTIDELDSFETNIWEDQENQNYEFDQLKSDQNVANIIRAVYESVIATHFGEDVIEDLFDRFAKRIKDHLSIKTTNYFNIVVSMTNN